MSTPKRGKSINELLDIVGRQTHAGFAMVVAAALDRVLEEALTAKMVKLNREMRDRVFGDFGTLRAFSAKINIAVAIGVADRETHMRLTMIRKVRNLFAHTNGYLSFDSQEVRVLIATELRSAHDCSNRPLCCCRRGH